MKNINLLGLLVLSAFLFLQCKPSSTWYVSPNGDDHNKGNLNAPFATIEKALEVSRRHKGKKNIIVKDGHYDKVSLHLSTKDTALTISGEEGASPVLYGGVRLSDWKKEGSFVYAEVPGTKDRDWDFRMLMVNAEWRQRARDPEQGAFTHLNDFKVRWLSSEAGGWERKPSETERTTLKYKEGDIPSDIDVHNAELTIFHEWDESLVGLASHDKEKGLLIFDNASQHPPGAFAERNPNAQTYVVWNTREGMHQKGQWYLDRSKERLYYWPKEGEDVSQMNVVVPTEQNIISFADHARNIRIKNLTLSATTTKLITGGYGAARFEGAVSGSRVQNISFEGVNVQNVGGWGLKLLGNDINIQHCDISNCGAGAIFYRGSRVKINNNRLHNIGLVYASAVGIFGKGSYNSVSNNEIFDMPYCGINGVGHHTIVENNVIHNIKTFMQDGGAIYVFGHKKTIMRNNVVLSDPTSGIKVYAYYLDEGCDSCIVENNIAYNTVVPVQAHMTRNCTYRNNVFLDEGDQRIAFANSNNMTFDRNILIAKEIVFSGPSKDSPSKIKGKLGKVMNAYSSATGISSWKDNILYSKSGRVIHRELAQYEHFNTKNLTESQGTLFTDPQITGIRSGNLKALENSPALLKGIELKDFTSAGHQTNLEALIEKYYTPADK